MRRIPATALALVMLLAAAPLGPAESGVTSLAPGTDSAGPAGATASMAEGENETEDDPVDTFPFDPLFEEYPEYEEVVDELHMLENNYPDIVRLYRLTDLVPNGQTWMGNHIWAVKISDGVAACPDNIEGEALEAALAAEQCEPDYYDNPDEETMLLVGNHHAREWMSVVTPFYFIYYLTYFYGAEPTDNDGDGLINEDPLDGVDNDGDGEPGGRTDEFGRAMFDGIDNDGDSIIDEGIDEDPVEARVTWLVDNREIWIIPTLNPDGYRYDREDPSRNWRKNLRDNDEDDRVNDPLNPLCPSQPPDGVDLNRNYPLEWSHNTQGQALVTTDGGVEYVVDDDYPCSDVYHGPQDDNDDDGDAKLLGYDPVTRNPIYDPDGVDEDPEDVFHQDDDNDGKVDEDRDGGFSEPETQVIEYLTWRLDIYDYEENPWDTQAPGASEYWPAMWVENNEGQMIRNYRTEKHDGRHNFVTMISYHSTSELYIWPWGFKGEDPPHESLLKDLVTPLMNWTGYGSWKEQGNYRVSGDITDWLYGNQGVLAYTIELNSGGQQGNLSAGFHADPRLIKPTVRMHLLSNIWLLEKSAEAQIAKDGNRYGSVAEVRYPSLEVLPLAEAPTAARYGQSHYSIRAVVTNADHLARDSLKVNYNVDGGEWREIPMECIESCEMTSRESIFEGRIPALDESGAVTYYIEGRDLRATTGEAIGGGFVYSGYGAATPLSFEVDDIIGFGNPLTDALAVGAMMLLLYGIVWGGLYHTINLAVVAERRKLAMPEE